ncbi:unnamed protein product [Rotaria sp. Silwood1]|nr:unnamed protein product [Rotaria sp. Silwood1]CAF0740782.1 unnamed protein product [Rotaria sp. Silwood1]CAF3354815.1 unnamed protein product [Rotaria sp. Silwood1]CAF4577729.1 unnamed protein product [Rotaria sp. Silwood1]
MGNDVRSRLHLNKKHDRDRGGKHEGETGHNIASGHNEVDNAILSGPNRARAVESNVSGTGSGGTTAHEADMANPTNTSRGRP